MKCKLFLPTLLFVCAGLFAQNVSLEQAVQTSTQAIETRLPKGAKTAVLTFTSGSQAFTNYIIDELATALSLSRNLQLIDRQYTDAIRKEFNIQFSGDVSDDEIKRIGQQLGAQYVVTGSLVDVGTVYRFRVAAINIETAVREGSPPLNININDPQVVFLLTGQRTTQTPPVVSTPKPTYKIGDTGPGGGTVFEISSDGTSGKEVVQLGRHHFRDGSKIASAYLGGGFTNWKLPAIAEMRSMYVNLKPRRLGNFVNEQYNAINGYFNFGNGSTATGLNSRVYVCAIRSF